MFFVFVSMWVDSHHGRRICTRDGTINIRGRLRVEDVNVKQVLKRSLPVSAIDAMHGVKLPASKWPVAQKLHLGIIPKLALRRDALRD
jgi:hypothetical protein